jgi:hypothetical protein
MTPGAIVHSEDTVVRRIDGDTHISLDAIGMRTFPDIRAYAFQSLGQHVDSLEPECIARCISDPEPCLVVAMPRPKSSRAQKRLNNVLCRLARPVNVMAAQQKAHNAAQGSRRADDLSTGCGARSSPLRRTAEHVHRGLSMLLLLMIGLT